MSRMNKSYRNYIIAFLILAVCTFLPNIEADAATANEKKAFTFFTETMGLKPAAACGIMANINAESRFIPDITGPGGSYGICQWLGIRKIRLQEYCGSRGYDYRSMTGQLHYLQHELKTVFPSVYNYLKGVSNTSSGAYNAAYHFCYYFEAPYDKASTSAYRGSLAQSTYWKSMGDTAVYLKAAAVGTGIKLTWNGSSKYKYKVYRSTSSSKNYSAIATIGAKAARTYTDKTVEKGKKYYYYILPINSKGNKMAKSNKISCTAKPSLKDDVCSIRLSKTAYTYSGKVKKPKVTVTYDGKTLKADTHYKVSYSDNKNAGTATVKVTGRGKYVGTVKLDYEIKKAEQKINVSAIEAVLKKTPITVKTSAKGKISLISEDPTIATVKSGKLYLKKAGITQVTIKAAATKNYKEAVQTFVLTVTPKKPVITKVKNASEGTVSLKWEKRSDLSGYQIQYIAGTKFSSKAKAILVDGKSTQATISDLKKGKTYSFRMRSYVEVDGKKVLSNWSKVKRIKLKK